MPKKGDPNAALHCFSISFNGLPKSTIETVCNTLPVKLTLRDLFSFLLQGTLQGAWSRSRAGVVARGVACGVFSGTPCLYPWLPGETGPEGRAAEVVKVGFLGVARPPPRKVPALPHFFPAPFPPSKNPLFTLHRRGKSRLRSSARRGCSCTPRNIS